MSIMLAIVAASFAIISLFDSRGRDLLGWAVLALAAIVLIPALT